MKNLKKLTPYFLELSTKFISLTTSILLASSLTVSEFGEYTYLRSFVLVSSTLLLFGLQTSTFQFANNSYEQRDKYSAFSIGFIAFIGVIFWLMLYLFGDGLFSKFHSDLGVYIQYLVPISMLSLFSIVCFKALGKPILGYSIALLTAVSLLSCISITFITTSIEIEMVFNYLIWVNISTSLVCLVLLFVYFQPTISNLNNWPIKNWFSVSSSMWLSGFFPIALLQGLVIIFGMYFSKDLLGYFGFAVLVVANMAMFKEVSTSLYLPKLISKYTSKNIIDKALLTRSILFGVIPILMMLIGILAFQKPLQRWYPQKLTTEVFTFIYVLGLSQIFMAMYQPIFRFLSAIGFHTTVLLFSLALLACLIFLYVLFGSLGLPYYMAASSGAVSFIALIISLQILNKKTVIKNG